MRFPYSHSLLGRHNVASLKPFITPRPAALSRAASSLTAIHNGLRQSQKSRPQGFDPASLETAKPRRPPRSGQNSRDPNWTPPTFKMKRGKKDITDTGPRAPSRRARFNDPNDSFGKRSLVYQMKHGALRDKMAELAGQERSRPRSSSPDRLSSGDFMKDFNSSAGRGTGSTRGGASTGRDRRPERRESRPRSFEGSDRNERGPSDRFSSRPRSFEGGNRKDRVSSDRFESRPRSFERNDRKDRGSSERFESRPRSFEGGDRKDRVSSDRFESRPRSFEGNDRKDRGSSERFESRPRSFEGSDRKERETSDRFSSRPRSFEGSDRNERGPSERFESRPRSFEGGDRKERGPSERFESRPRSDAGTRSFDKERTRRPDDASAFGNRESSGYKPSQWSGSRRSGGEDARGEDESRRDDGPVRIHHTTAASQFLYGRSVVEAALKDSRRQLYKLYIYNGDDRQNVSSDDTLAKLAQQKAVEVTHVPNSGLRMMDKMSNGRPHNGCVLEASPLPQLPLKALGPLSEDPTKTGFHLELGHQSSEEAQVNGTSDFIGYQLPKERKPFVLLLDGILDPGNLGGILRTAGFLGVNAVGITKSSSATLTPVALKASVGASEVLSLFAVNSTADFLSRSKENGWLVYAAVPATRRSRGNSHLTVDRVEEYDPLAAQPTVLVIGSEGEGLSKPIRRLADHEVSIPSPTGGFSNVVDSLNVNVATGILCSSFLKKQTSGMMEIEDAPAATGSQDAPIATGSQEEEESEEKLW
ncbi:hypothetical protein F4808DRAFT_408303 [Astrocystis sublimbata]|nr:hypothetical protein F4808DRAFT_408303 [Astrocystis sublimbata]